MCIRDRYGEPRSKRPMAGSGSFGKPVWTVSLEKKGTGVFDGWTTRTFELHYQSKHRDNPCLVYLDEEDQVVKGIVDLFRHTRLSVPHSENAELKIIGCRVSNRAADGTTLELRAPNIEVRHKCFRHFEAAIDKYTKTPREATRIREIAFIAGAIDHRRYHLKKYESCVVASELVDVLSKAGHAASREEAVDLCQELVRNDELHHVCDDHPFEDTGNFYRFTADDKLAEQAHRESMPAPFHRIHESSAEVSALLNLVSRTAYANDLVLDRWYHLSLYPDCVVASELVTCLVAEHQAVSRKQAVQMCQELVKNDELHHVCDDHDFEDTGNFYRFTLSESTAVRLKRKKAPSAFRLQQLLGDVEELQGLSNSDLEDSVFLDLMQSLYDPDEETAQPPKDTPVKQVEKLPVVDPPAPALRVPLEEVPEATDLENTAVMLTQEFRSWVVIALAIPFAISIWLGVVAVLVLGLLHRIASNRSLTVSRVMYENSRRESMRPEQLIELKNKELYDVQQKILDGKRGSTGDLRERANSLDQEIQQDVQGQKKKPAHPEEPAAEPAEQGDLLEWQKVLSPGEIHSSQTLKVFVFGADKSNLKPVDVNVDSEPVDIGGSVFVGRMVVRVLGLQPATHYFDGKSRRFSIQIQGAFTQDVCCDDVEFGAVFDKPINLPFGASIGLALAHKIDPALREDLEGESPWMMSPLICAMNRLKVTPLAASRELPEWEYGGDNRLEENSGDFLPPDQIKIQLEEGKRRHFFQKKERRKAATFRKNKVIEFEFLSSLVDFTQFEVSLGIRKSVRPYLNGQPVRFEARCKGVPIFGVVFDGSELDIA
eukprot:TRINITY_DN11680_c0_g1_i2.p1 TRINITY_DN11680_c0_g1~~TRINITY_DN11680_c0_g1_i2.p1  ORF type:complete len:842 (+),score=177.81 TRINITY_DN11680_c0_g1_i2:46-2526(+)